MEPISEQLYMANMLVLEAGATVFPAAVGARAQGADWVVLVDKGARPEAVVSRPEKTKSLHL